MQRHRALVIITMLFAFGCADGTSDETSGVTVSPPSLPAGMGPGSATTPPMTIVASAGAGPAGAGAQAGAGGANTAGMSAGMDAPGIAGVGGMAMGVAGAAMGVAGATMGRAGASGSGDGSMAGRASAGTGSLPPGAKMPIIPSVTADCPPFQNGTITFMGLSGIAVQAGTKASGPTAPMVFYWHGTGSSAGEYAGAAAAVHQGAMQEGGVLVSFQGTKGGDLLSGTYVFGAGDFALTDQVSRRT